MYHIENMRVDMNYMSILLTMYHIQVSLVPDTFSSIVDKSWCFCKIELVEKMHKKGESCFFRKP
jgi:hypothetical protein